MVDLLVHMQGGHPGTAWRISVLPQGLSGASLNGCIHHPYNLSRKESLVLKRLEKLLHPPLHSKVATRSRANALTGQYIYTSSSSHRHLSKSINKRRRGAWRLFLPADTLVAGIFSPLLANNVKLREEKNVFAHKPAQSMYAHASTAAAGQGSLMGRRPPSSLLHTYPRDFRPSWWCLANNAAAVPQMPSIRCTGVFNRRFSN